GASFACKTSHRMRRSSTERVKPPTVSSDPARGLTPVVANRLSVGLYPTTPQKAAGRMMEPEVWVPSARGTWPSATAAAEPLDEPPGVRPRLCGLRVLLGW